MTAARVVIARWFSAHLPGDDPDGTCHGCRMAGDHTDGLVAALADAGLVITAEADGSEHSGAHALRAAADDIDLPGYDAQGYYSGNGAHGYHQAEGHAATYLRTRAAELEGN